MEGGGGGGDDGGGNTMLVMAVVAVHGVMPWRVVVMRGGQLECTFRAAVVYVKMHKIMSKVLICPRNSLP